MIRFTGVRPPNLLEDMGSSVDEAPQTSNRSPESIFTYPTWCRGITPQSVSIVFIFIPENCTVHVEILTASSCVLDGCVSERVAI